MLTEDENSRISIENLFNEAENAPWIKNIENKNISTVEIGV
jgi:hypothetical protein